MQMPSHPSCLNLMVPALKLAPRCLLPADAWAELVSLSHWTLLFKHHKTFQVGPAAIRFGVCCHASLPFLYFCLRLKPVCTSMETVLCTPWAHTQGDLSDSHPGCLPDGTTDYLLSKRKGWQITMMPVLLQETFHNLWFTSSFMSHINCFP